MTPTYPELVDLVADSQQRLEATVSALTDNRVREPSALPGWTRGHVVTHLARNADGLRRFAIGTANGVPADMYPGGPDARAAAIEEGAGRPATLLTADLRFAGRRLIDDLRGLDPDLLGTPLRWRRPVTAGELPVLRWRELEIHHVDLDSGYTCANWPAAFVESTLATELPALAATAPEITPPNLPRADLLSWLIGRPTRGDLPALPSWPF